MRSNQPTGCLILTPTQRDACLVGLRILGEKLSEEGIEFPVELEADLTNEWSHPPISDSGLNDLCELLNGGGK